MLTNNLFIVDFNQLIILVRGKGESMLPGYKEIKKAKTAERCWLISIALRYGSRMQRLALKKFLNLSNCILSCLNIFCNFPFMRVEALGKILSFGSTFEKCLKLLKDVDHVLELKMLVLEKALGFATTVEKCKILLQYFPDCSEGAHICLRRIYELSSPAVSEEKKIYVA